MQTTVNQGPYTGENDFNLQKRGNSKVDNT